MFAPTCRGKFYKSNSNIWNYTCHLQLQLFEIYEFLLKKKHKNAHVQILCVLMLWINIVRFEKFSNKFNHNTVIGLNPGVISKVGWV